jgi:hypothetical protein
VSRFREGDDDYEFAVLDQGRWQNNARRALKSPRGRKALAAIRDALLALPGQRLIHGALCTVGGPERVAEVTDTEIDAHVAELQAKLGRIPSYYTRDRIAELMRRDRDEERAAIEETIGLLGQGCGVCALGALLWHLRVKQGLTPDEAFAALPTVAGGEDCDPLSATAELAARDAGIAYTLATELGFRNDETYGRMTPEERYTAFLGWIDAELGDAESPPA